MTRTLIDDNGDLRGAAERWCKSKGVNPDDLLTRRQAAALIGFSATTLASYASQRIGPPFVVIGRCRYRALDAAMWLFQQIRDPARSAYAAAVERRRARGDQIGRPPKVSAPRKVDAQEMPAAA
jgi:hypothetical protein